MTANYQQWINRSGESFLKAINGLTQIAKIHADNNDILADSIQKFVRLLKKLGQDDSEVAIHLSEGRFYFQGEKLYLRPANAALFNRMVRYMEERGLYGLQIDADLQGVAPQHIVAFFRQLDQCVKQDDPSTWLTDQIVRRQMQWVSVAQTPYRPNTDDAAPLDDLTQKKAAVRKTYAGTLSSIKEIAGKLATNQRVGMRNSVRLVQKMVDIITEDETLFLGISTIRIYDDYTYTHSLNVAILAMCLGKHIGLNRLMLERLGLCGLFHDLGKVAIPRELLNKQGSLNEDEYAVLKTHSMHSARLILRLKSKDDRKSKILVPPFEHHMGYDHSGYPKVLTGPKISLFGRILTIVDVYDAITSPRIYRKNALSPDKAIAQMATQSGTHFDPILFKVFVGMMGVYPVGTLVKLDSGELGIVKQPSKRTGRSRPIVQCIIRDDDQSYSKGAVVDLADRDDATGEYFHNIIATMHPSTIGVQAAAFLL